MAGSVAETRSRPPADSTARAAVQDRTLSDWSPRAQAPLRNADKEDLIAVLHAHMYIHMLCTRANTHTDGGGPATMLSTLIPAKCRQGNRNSFFLRFESHATGSTEWLSISGLKLMKSVIYGFQK